MGDVVYVLAATTCLVCALLLARGYKHSGQRLLLWSTVCFVGLFVNNVLTVVDVLVLTDVNLHLLRSAFGCGSVAVLAFALVGATR